MEKIVYVAVKRPPISLLACLREGFDRISIKFFLLNVLIAGLGMPKLYFKCIESSGSFWGIDLLMTIVIAILTSVAVIKEFNKEIKNEPQKFLSIAIFSLADWLRWAFFKSYDLRSLAFPVNTIYIILFILATYCCLRLSFINFSILMREGGLFRAISFSWFITRDIIGRWFFLGLVPFLLTPFFVFTYAFLGGYVTLLLAWPLMSYMFAGYGLAEGVLYFKLEEYYASLNQEQPKQLIELNKQL